MATPIENELLHMRTMQAQHQWRHMAWGDVAGLPPVDQACPAQGGAVRASARTSTGTSLVQTPRAKEYPFCGRDGWRSTKRDEQAHNSRSRSVAMQINKQKMNGLYATTPLREAMQLLISDSASLNGDTFKEEEKVIMLNAVA